MADIFLSYSREDEARIKGLVAEFEAQGWTVFWDRRIPAGETWRSYIGAALQDARCIVVAWSKFSVESQWVTEEADEGKTRKILVPVLLDQVPAPRGFREIQAADISGWQPGQASERFTELIGDLRRILGKPSASAREMPPAGQPFTPERKAEGQAGGRSMHGRRTVLVALLAVFAIGIAGYFVVGSLQTGKQHVPSPSIPMQAARDRAVTADATRSGGSWLVVAGSFGRDDLQSAERHHLRLTRAGLDSTVIDSNDYPLLAPNLWVVAIGPFESRETANAALSRVRTTVPDAYTKMGR